MNTTIIEATEIVIDRHEGPTTACGERRFTGPGVLGRRRVIPPCGLKQRAGRRRGPPMWRIELRPSIKIEITKPAPWSGATSEGVASMPEVAS